MLVFVAGVRPRDMEASLKVDVHQRRVFIVLVNWNRPADTIECLDSLLRLDHQNATIVVIDNGSTDDSLERIWSWTEQRLGRDQLMRFASHDRDHQSDWDRRFVLIEAGSNLGFAGGCNLGISYGRSRDAHAFVWLVNNDTVVDRTALTMLIAVAADDSSVGIVGSKLLYYDRPDRIQTAGGARINRVFGTSRYQASGRRAEEGNHPFHLDYIMGASMLVRDEVFEQIGMLDPMYFLGWEETDFCTRAVRRGWKLGYAWESRVWHKESATIGRRSRSSDYYGVRNSIIYLRRFDPWAVPLVLLIGLPLRLIRRIFRREASRIPLILRAYYDGVVFRRAGKPPEPYIL